MLTNIDMSSTLHVALAAGDNRSAIGLYERFGYTPAPLWGEYLSSPETSRCYRKTL